LKVNITNTHLKIHLKNQSEPYFEAEFCEKIKADESNWSVEDQKCLILFLEKNQEVIWKSAFKGHKEIDTKKVDNSKRIDEFDNETQAALNKIVYEQNRKKNGLPTTEEEKKLKSLQDAWNAPDSPFKGQPFDPSMFNLNEPIYFNTPDYEAKLRAKQEKENENKK
jgi:hypothetical protein